MFKLTIKHLLANKVRFALTTLGVTLAVSFVVSAFVLGDGLRSTFTKVSEEVTAGVDLEVRNTADFGDPPPLPPDTVESVSGIAGVADAVPSIESAYNEVQRIEGTLIAMRESIGLSTVARGDNSRSSSSSWLLNRSIISRGEPAG